ncbi:MAG: NAD-dependent DNA ligase LigA [Myxococcales bacterium]|nr:NAD-dependent DNA ligase LigA [Myxococcales bacterium]
MAQRSKRSDKPADPVSADRPAPGLAGGLAPRGSRDRVDALAARLERYRASYYAGQPDVSDAAYDALEDELRALDPAHPALARVGAPTPVEGWEKARHELPMGSLNKVVTAEELGEWAARCDELLAKVGEPPISGELFVAEKLDGISLEVVYRDGQLAEAITRGDGEVGERITANVRRMRGVPGRVPDARPLSVRGEIILRLSDMARHFPDAVSPRNAAAGTARRFDGTGCEHLTVLFYDLADELDVATEAAKFELLRGLGLATPRTFAGTLAEVVDLYRRYAEGLRAELDYEIDGLVVRAARVALQHRLGEVNRRPRAAVAFKFAHPTAVTRVLEVRWSIGAGGRVTPIAIFEPVELAGASVRRASLHNVSLLRELGVGVGDEVLVSRRNDVIPYIEEVVEKHGPVAEAPVRCAGCGAPLAVDGEYLACRNAACPARVEGRVRKWIDSVGVLEWGEKLIGQLVQKGLVREPCDLYRLTVDDIAALERHGRKSADNALHELHARLPLALPTFLAALGIEGFALETARLLVGAGLGDLAALRAATEEEIARIHGLGPAKAAAIVRGLAERAPEIERLLAAGIVPVTAAQAGPLGGRSFCITGSHRRGRKELVALIEDHGGRVSNGVTKDLDYLVIADPASTSSKADKARRYGTRLISESELDALVAGGEAREP